MTVTDLTVSVTTLMFERALEESVVSGVESIASSVSTALNVSVVIVVRDRTKMNDGGVIGGGMQVVYDVL